MRFGSICSGIEAASQAFGPLDWKAQWFSEIEPFPCAVLKTHYPDVPNLGDMTKIRDNEVFKNATVDLICGGTPCQSFSIAGLRKGMDDARGNLALEFIRICAAAKPRWVLWENVPGALSSWSGSNPPRDLQPEQRVEDTEASDFGCFLEALREIGYGFAYRVFNAEYFGVPQSRRRIFVVGYFGDWRPAAAVLLESKMLRGDIAEGGEKGEAVAGDIENDIGADGKPLSFKIRGGCEGGGKGYLGSEDKLFTIASTQDQNILVPKAYRWQNEKSGIVPTDKLSTLKSNGTTTDERTVGAFIMATGQGGAEILEGRVPTLNCNHEAPIVFRGEGRSKYKETHTAGPVRACGAKQSDTNLVVSAFKQRPEGDIIQSEKAYNISTTSNASAGNTAKNLCGASVRRLTPLECERAQGFPDNYTQIPYKGKPADKCPDGPRYKAIGNSWAVPCAAWIGKRIQMFEDITKLTEEILW